MTDACLGGMVAAAAFTAYWYLYQYRPQVRAMSNEPTSPKIDLAPWVQPSGGGMAAMGTF